MEAHGDEDMVAEPTDQQMAQALAELAEQNAALIAAVTRLKRQLRWLALALVLASSAFVAVVVLGVG